MIHNLVSIKKVIAKVFADLQLPEGNYPISDFIEWAGEALKKIGAFPSFINKVTGKGGEPLLVLFDYQTLLPCDLHSIQQVAYSKNINGPFFSMRYGTGSFDYEPKLTSEIETVGVDNTVATSDLITIVMRLYNLDYDAAVIKINTEPDIREIISGMVNDEGIPIFKGLTQTSFDYIYTITNNYIKTNIKDGYLMVAYQAIPTDIDKYPMIPNDESFMEAIYWYIVMKLKFPEWMEGRIRDAVYYRIENKWNYYCKQAYGNAMMPNIDQLESIKNTWLKLVPEIGQHETFFSTLGQKQIVYNQNSVLTTSV
jgi:hypothetical protein